MAAGAPNSSSIGCRSLTCSRLPDKHCEDHLIASVLLTQYLISLDLKSNERCVDIGMVNYHHRFIPHCATKLTPLNTKLTAANEGHTRLSPKSNFDLKWKKSADLAFIESKQILANATLLVHPGHSAPLNITCDASDFAVGGVLQQYIDNVWQRHVRPRAFSSVCHY